jgi:hypothetical protein
MGKKRHEIRHMAHPVRRRHRRESRAREDHAGGGSVIRSYRHNPNWTPKQCAFEARHELAQTGLLANPATIVHKINWKLFGKGHTLQSTKVAKKYPMPDPFSRPDLQWGK